MNRQRFLSCFLISAVLGVFLFTACGEKKSAVAAPADAKQMVRWLYPGSEGNHHAEITDYINGMLDKDNMNIQFQAIPIAWDVWEQKINLMFSTGEPFEFVHVPEGFGPGYVELWNLGASTRVNELIDQYAPTVKKNIPDWLWEAATIEGNITTIPAYWVETANLKGGITLRKDLYEKYNLQLPRNLDELIDRSKELQQLIIKNEDYGSPPYVYMRYQEIQTFPHRTYDTYPFTVIEQFLLIRQDGKVEPWVDSEEFKKDCEFFARLYGAGLVSSEILSLNVDNIGLGYGMGNYVFSEYNTTNTTDSSMELNAHIEGIRNEYILFNPEKKILRDQGVRNSNIVSSTSPNPEAAVRFHEWMYANKDAYLAVQFGIEGVTYTMENGETEAIPDETNLGLADWMVANINLQPRAKGVNQQWMDTAAREETNAVNSIIIGFAFDPTPVSTQYTNCISEVKNVIYPLRAGVVNYANSYNAASAAFKAAGIDVVIAEYQRQLASWLDSKK
jgi:putative aldouronate transport system substrate-binding protein